MDYKLAFYCIHLVNMYTSFGGGVTPDSVMNRDLMCPDARPASRSPISVCTHCVHTIFIYMYTYMYRMYVYPEYRLLESGHGIYTEW